MRKTIIAVTLCTLSLMTSPAFSGPGHEHSTGPISAEAVQQEATKHVVNLVSKGKLEQTWSGIKPTKVHQKTFEKGPEWIVEFVNSAVSDAAKQTLYLFYTLDGHYLAANFTGN